LNYSCLRTSPDIVPPDEDRFHLLDIPPAENCSGKGSLHRDPSTCDDRPGESSPLLSPVCSHSDTDSALQPLPIFDHDSEENFVTVHEFLQDTTNRVGRKYGRRDRPATAKPDAQTVETRSDRYHVSAYHEARIQARHRDIAHRAPRPRRKKLFAKSLAQRLFEADVFSTGTSPLSRRPTSVRSPTHTSTRQPLQFVTSLNLTPSLESRMYNKRKGRQGWAREGLRQAPGLADSGILAVLNPNPAQDAPPIRPAVSASTSGSSGLTRNKDTTQRARTGGSAAGVMDNSTSGRRAQVFRTRGVKQSTGRVTTNPFGYVPLPLVKVKTRKGAAQ
jgi:hypothetical protein